MGAHGEPQAIEEDVQLDALVADAVERARRRAPNVVFETSYDNTVVRGSRERIHRAVSNLPANAVKWSPAGGVVEVRVADGAVSVRDHGPGIDDNDLPHVFDRFYRSVDARSAPGSGLGLSIVTDVASANGGSTFAENHPAGGAVVGVVLPPAKSTA